VTKIELCWCDKPSRGGLTKEPCTRPVTQEDMLCDQCRDGCTQISVGVIGQPETMRVLATHSEAGKVFGYARQRP
jgi:hypothetical protein